MAKSALQKSGSQLKGVKAFYGMKELGMLLLLLGDKLGQ